MGGQWRWAAASRCGTAHAANGERRQDAFRVVGGGDGGAFCAVVCDGAGSAPHGGEGASLAARSLTCSARAHFDRGGDLPGDDEVAIWMGRARDAITSTSAARGLATDDFATTVVMAMAIRGETVVAHIGDGAAAGRENSTSSWVALSWPDQGEHACETFFLTDAGAPRLRIARYDGPLDRIVLTTDGLERLALNFAARTPHVPFFDGISGPVANGIGAGRLDGLSRRLGAFLDSDPVNARTDDDKTIVVAVVG